MFRNIAFLFTGILFAGCNVGTYEPYVPPPDTTSIVLEIVPGDLSDITLMGGTTDAELLRFDIVNRSARDVVLRSLPVGIAHEDGSAAAAGSFTDVKFVDRAGIYTLMGPQDLRPEIGANIYFEGDEVPLPAGESITLVLRSDLATFGERYLVTVGALVALIEDAVFADTLEHVTAERMRNNRILGRDITVLPVEMMEMPETTTALVVTFRPEQGILHPDDGWVRLGTLGLDSYGGDSIFRGSDVFGGNLGLFSSISLADASGRIVGSMTTPISACSCGSVRLLEPATVTAGGHMELDVIGTLSTDSDRGDITFGLDRERIDASAVDDGDFVIILSATDQSHFRVWNTHPVVTALTLSTTTLINDVEQDLYKIQVSSAVGGRSLHVGSLTFRINGFGTSGQLTDIGLRIGSTTLSPSVYRIVRTDTGETIRFPERSSTGGIVVHGDSIGNSPTFTGSEQITLIFTDPDGLLISGSGHVLTLVATPSGFATGDVLQTFFGDYVFSSGALSWGNMTDTGRITVRAGEEGLVDPIVWMADSGVGGVYTGAWSITDLSRFGILTR